MKNTKETKDIENIKPKSWYIKLWAFVSSAAFAWLIIWTLAVFVAGCWTGTVARSQDNAYIQSEVNAGIDNAIDRLK
jgi:hypothetical protein